MGTTENVRVCKNFFLKTLDVGERTIFVTKNKQLDADSPFTADDLHGKHPPKHKLSDVALQRVKTHIESFPRIESHYCRKRTRRRFLNPELSISKMYQLYKEHCEKNQQPDEVKFGTYSKIFNTQYNLSFFKPNKDTCRICEKQKNMSEEEKPKMNQR